MRDPVLAAILSALIPGVGQLYNRQWGWALFWLIFTPGLWIGSGGTLGWLCHIISAYMAYTYAEQNRNRY